MNASWMETTVTPETRLSLDDSGMKNLVRDLHRADRRVYWIDLITTVVAGWLGFYAAVTLKPFGWAATVCGGVAVCALYRALCFMHEITHQTDRSLPGFEAAWNWLVGFPLLMPSFVYVGVHQSHHRISTYGTAQDPEYLPFAHSRRMTVAFAAESFFIPFALLLRFLILTPIAFLVPRFERWLTIHGSSLTMNVRYCREVNAATLAKVRRDSAVLWLMWAGAIGAAAGRMLPWRAFAVWLAVDSLISFVNTLRTLGSHGYENTGEELDRAGQLLDSIDTPGAFWTELWAPVGLRYHALHHYFPGIPYHNLPEAYRRIMSHLTLATEYGRVSSPSLQHSLAELIQKGAREDL